jgi:hypothetical protein
VEFSLNGPHGREASRSGGGLGNLDHADVLEKSGESLRWVTYRSPFGPVGFSAGEWTVYARCRVGKRYSAMTTAHFRIIGEVAPSTHVSELPTEEPPKTDSIIETSPQPSIDAPKTSAAVDREYTEFLQRVRSGAPTLPPAKKESGKHAKKVQTPDGASTSVASAPKTLNKARLKELQKAGNQPGKRTRHPLRESIPKPPEKKMKDVVHWSRSMWVENSGPKSTYKFVYTLKKVDGSEETWSTSIDDERPPPSAADWKLAEDLALMLGGPLNAKVLEHAQPLYGQQVGNGGCQELGRVLYGMAGCIVNEFDRNYHGKNPLSKEVEKIEDIAPGDVLEFHWAVFEGTDADGVNHTMNAGVAASNGWHYAMALSQYDPATGTLVCLDQNVNGYMKMMHQEYNFKQLKSGKYRIIRPVEKYNPPLRESTLDSRLNQLRDSPRSFFINNGNKSKRIWGAGF